MQYKKLLALVCLLSAITGAAQTRIVVNPAQRFQTIKGFGVSLCWWANIMGGWGQPTIDKICHDLADKDELNFNYFRFNIGGGDAPAHHHMRKDGGAMPGYKASRDAAYDWQADSNQVRILKKLYALRKDAIYEAFSNSPPYWMTKSGCTSGDTSGGENLADNEYGVFADYLTDVVKHFKETEGITFSRLEPFNEPFSDWWKANGGQEGCQFLETNQRKLIDSVYQRLAAKNMLTYCQVAAMDANTIDEAVRGVKGYAGTDIFKKIASVATHSYAGTERSQLYKLAAAAGKEVWQTETGPLNIKSKGLDNYLHIAGTIVKDLKEMQAVVWTDWQAVSLDDGWGLWLYNIGARTYDKQKTFYLRKQFSKYIKPGYTIIQSNGNSIAALNSTNTELVVVLVNQDSTTNRCSLDLTRFIATGKMAVVRTTATENCRPVPAPAVKNKMLTYTMPAKSVTTFIIPVKL